MKRVHKEILKTQCKNRAKREIMNIRNKEKNREEKRFFLFDLWNALTFRWLFSPFS